LPFGKRQPECHIGWFPAEDKLLQGMGVKMDSPASYPAIGVKVLLSGDSGKL